jgi:hypothetical protein
MVDRLFSAPRVHIQGSERFVFIAIDPCAGSEDVSKNMSDFAVVSIAHKSDTVIGIEAIPATRHSDYRERLFTHLERLRQPGSPFRNATLVFDLEGNGSIEWSRLEEDIRGKFKGVVFMSDFKVNKTGATWTTTKMKEECAVLTQEMMSRGTLGIWSEFVTTGKEADILKEWEKQMRAYERTRSATTKRNARGAVTYSGKGANGKARDDIGFTMQRALRSRGRFFTQPEYVQYRT